MRGETIEDGSLQVLCTIQDKTVAIRVVCAINKEINLPGCIHTKNPPQTILRGIFVEHRRIELLTF